MSGMNAFPTMLYNRTYFDVYETVAGFAKNYNLSLWNAIRIILISPLLPKSFLNIYRDICRIELKRCNELNFVHSSLSDKVLSKRKNLQGIYSSSFKTINKQIVSNVLESTCQQMLETHRFFSDKYHCRFIYPLLDKIIIEFCTNVPPYEYIAGGWKRSLFRRAMRDILPEKIRWRKDKSTFSKSYRGYILQSSNFVRELMEKRNSLVWDMIDRNKLNFYVQT